MSLLAPLPGKRASTPDAVALRDSAGRPARAEGGSVVLLANHD